MKIFIVPSWYPSNQQVESGTFFKDRAKMLADAGHDVTLIVNIIHPPTKILQWRRMRYPITKFFEEDGLRTYRQESINRYPKLHRLWLKNYQHQILLQISAAFDQQGRPDFALVHSSLWAGAALADWFRAKKIPFIVSEHLKEFLIPGGFNDFQRYNIQKTYRSTNRIVATSRALKNAIITKFPESKNKIVTIPNPSDFQVFQRFQTAANNQKKEFTFISVALFRPEKRIDLLLKSFSRLVKKELTVRLLLIGDGPERRKIKRLVKKLKLEKMVGFLGYLSKTQVASALRESNVLVLASNVETFGVALVEAMACGQPVIATRCGGPESIVTDDTGILVNTNDENALAGAMENMISTYKKYSATTIRERTQSVFSATAYVNSIEKLLAEIVEDRR